MTDWRPLWRQIFREEPSPDTRLAMDTMVQLCSPHLDDPLVIITMYMQRQCELFSGSCSRFRVYVGELERASSAVRDASSGIQHVSSLLMSFVEDVQVEVAAAKAEVSDLAAETVNLRRFGHQVIHELHHARQKLAAQNSLWRLDLKLVLALAFATSIAMNVALVKSVISRPTLSVETAASQLASADDAPRLIALQQSGDLQMVLRCEGTNWKKTEGYCRPVAGKSGIQGWHTIPTNVPDILR